MPTSLLKYAAAAAISLGASLALAQTTAPNPASPAAKSAATAPAKATAKPRSALSQECSKKADAQGLHGKARKKFRSACKRGKA
ncbi:MAG: phosphate starvation-inducible protein PsiF [Hyphomicrobiales bacterium]|nr:phosphate starvation-inducible protein PsiF [Hyphomicrobiales bacterium]